MPNADAKFIERFSNFEKFRAQFSTFDEFRKPFENRDIGLQRAVALAMRELIENFVFPDDVQNDNEMIEYVFKQIDELGISKKKLANGQRLRMNKETFSVYISLINRWARNPAKKQIPPKDDTEPLIIFFYLTHFAKDETGKVRDRYWFIVLNNLKPEGVVAVERKSYFARKSQDKLEEEELKYPPQAKGNESSLSDFQSADSASNAEVVSDVLRGIKRQPHLKLMLQRLDYSDHEGAFVFDPNKFRNSAEEGPLDDLLYALSDAGGVLRRAGVSLQDTILIRAYVIMVMGNPQVHAYLRWLHQPDQLPNHVDFLDAIYLFERLTVERIPILVAYRERAERILDELQRRFKDGN